MTTVPSPTAFLHLLVGYDGSPPARRALDAAAWLLQGRTGRIDVVYVAHTPVVADAPVDPVDMERGLDQIEQELRARPPSSYATAGRPRGPSAPGQHRPRADRGGHHHP